MELSKFEFKVGLHNKHGVIFIRFEKDYNLINQVKALVGAKWSQSKKAWYVPDNEGYRKQFGLRTLEESLPSDEGIEGIEKFKRHLQSKRYSDSTIKTYSEALKSFFIYYRENLLIQ